jgi:hypothetical protein
LKEGSLVFLLLCGRNLRLVDAIGTWPAADVGAAAAAASPADRVVQSLPASGRARPKEPTSEPESVFD